MSPRFTHGDQPAHLSSSVSAVVTGAASGIGLAIARELIAAGMGVIGVDVDAPRLRDAGRELGDCFFEVEGDVAEWKTHEAAAEAAAQQGRALRYWVNCAGIDLQGSAHEVTPEHVDLGLRVLLGSALLGTARAVQEMRGSGGGSIVNVASIQGIVAFPGYFVYGVAKAGMLQIARSIAVDYGRFGIRCNSVLPGTVETPMTMSIISAAPDPDAAMREEGTLSPMNRIAKAQEIADAVLFLLSEDASYVNGTSLIVDGGSSSRCFAYPAGSSS